MPARCPPLETSPSIPAPLSSQSNDVSDSMAPIFIVYEVNLAFEEVEPPIYGEVLAAFTSRSAAETAAVKKRATRSAYSAPIKVLRVSVPTIGAYNGDDTLEMKDIAKLDERPALAPTPLSEAAVYVLALEGHGCGEARVHILITSLSLHPFPITGTQAIFATRAEADGLVDKWHRSGTACDQCEGFSYEITRIPVE